MNMWYIKKMRSIFWMVIITFISKKFYFLINTEIIKLNGKKKLILFVRFTAQLEIKNSSTKNKFEPFFFLCYKLVSYLIYLIGYFWQKKKKEEN